MDTDNIIMDIDELCVYLNMSKSTIYKLTQEGRIPCQKVGRRWRFHRDVIDRWLADQGPYHVEPVLSPMVPTASKTSAVENGNSEGALVGSSTESVNLTYSVNAMGPVKTTGPVRLAGASRPAGSMKSTGTTKAKSSLKSAVSILSENPVVFFEKEQQKILKRSSISSIGSLLVLLATDQGKNQLADLLMISREELDQIALRITHYINNVQEK